jgi:hypothetical protein
MAIKRSDYATLAEYQAALNRSRQAAQSIAPTSVKTTPTIVNTGARDTAGNLMTGQSNQSAGVVAAAANREAINAGTTTQAQQQTARDKAMADALKSSKTINNYTFQDTANLAAQSALNQKYNLDPLTGLTGKPLISQGSGVAGVQIPQEQARDFTKELAMAKKLGINLAEITPEQEKKLFQATYTQQELQQKGLMDYVSQPAPMGATGVAGGASGTGATGTGSVYDPALLKAQGYTDEQIAALSGIGNQANAAAQTLSGAPKPENSNMYVLQEALKMATGTGEKGQTMTESDLYNRLGIGGAALGFDALNSAIEQRRNEMGARYDNYAQMVKVAGSQVLGTYNAALEGYKTVMEQYNNQMEVMSKINEAAQEHERALELLDKKASLDKETYLWEKEIEAKYAEPENPWKYQAETEYQPAGWVNASTQEFKPLDYSGKGSEIPVGDSILSKNAVWDILGLDTNGQCGTKSSTISTASKVGNYWNEKKTKIDKTDNPKTGDKLLIPLGVKSGKNPYGHVATVLSVNYDTGDMVVAEWNRNSDGKGKISNYNINELNKQYGKGEWGFASGDLKGNVKKALNNSSGLLGTIVKRTYQGAATAGIAGGALGFLGGSGEALGEMRKNAVEQLPLDQRYFDATGKTASKAELKEIAKLPPEKQRELFNQLSHDTAASKTRQSLAEQKDQETIQAQQEEEELNNYMNYLIDFYGGDEAKAKAYMKSIGYDVADI